MLKVAHRGASGYAPENTLFSIQKALDMKADIIEIDVRVCKTGEFVLMHDDSVDRTTDDNGLVVEKTLLDLKNLDAGKGEKIPTLREALKLIDKKCRVNIDLKYGSVISLYKLIGVYVDRHGWSYHNFIISSTNYNVLIELNNMNSNVKTALIIKDSTLYIKNIIEKTNLYSVNVEYSLLDQNIVYHAHQSGKKVFAWTVNEYDNIKSMRSMFVDGIVSNYPDRL